VFAIGPENDVFVTTCRSNPIPARVHDHDQLVVVFLNDGCFCGAFVSFRAARVPFFRGFRSFRFFPPFSCARFQQDLEHWKLETQTGSERQIAARAQ